MHMVQYSVFLRAWSVTMCDSGHGAIECAALPHCTMHVALCIEEQLPHLGEKLEEERN